MSPAHIRTNSRVEVEGHYDLLHERRPVYKFYPSAAPARKALPAAPATRSMIGLLTLAAIPTTIAVSEAVAERDTLRARTDPLREARQLRKFAVRCYCAGSSTGKRDVHGGTLCVGTGAVWIRSPAARSALRDGVLEAEAFYVEYPDPGRTPPVLGLVTAVRRSPPLLNWIFVDRKTRQVRHANRTGSIEHWVGDFGATDDFEEPDTGDDEPSGITFDGDEKFVAVRPRKGSREEAEGLWEVWWDENDDKLNGGKDVDGRQVLRISLEREFLEDEGA